MSYEVFVESDVHRARTRLPGNVRQRMRGFISSLAAEPRPHGSELLDAEGIDLPAGVEVRRYRLDPWRLVYAVNDEPPPLSPARGPPFFKSRVLRRKFGELDSSTGAGSQTAMSFA